MKSSSNQKWCNNYQKWCNQKWGCSETVTARTRPGQLRAKRNPSMEKQKQEQGPTPKKKFLLQLTAPETRCNICLQWSDTLYFSLGQNSCSGGISQQRIDSVVGFVCLFVFEKKEHLFFWVERGRKNLIKVYYIKCFNQLNNYKAKYV